jgi:hypothetical protein
MFGQRLIEIADKSLIDAQQLARQCCGRSARITPEEGHKLLVNMKNDQPERMAYSLPGDGKMYRFFQLCVTIEQHNCLSWCEKQLALIDVSLTKVRWKDGIANIPSSKLPATNDFKRNDDNDPTSAGAKCELS